jgi:tripartite ATP-independent transporter DctP family solute receptor
MNQKKHYLQIIFFAAVFLLITGFSVSAKTITFKFAHVCPEDHPYQTSAKVFVDMVAKKTNGSLKINLYPSGALGGERDIAESLQMGLIDIMWNSMGVTATFVEDVNIFNLPFIFKGKDNFIKVAEGSIGNSILNKFDKNRLKGLAFAGPIFRIPMNNKKPINAPADFKNLKIRLMEVPVHIATYKALGASPTPIPFPELYTSLQLGVVEACENAIGTLYSSKFYEVQKYLTILPVFSNGAVLMMSKKSWNKLSADQQKAIKEAVPPTVAALDKAFDAMGKKGLMAMRKYGVKVNTPSNIAPFVKAVEPVYKDYLAKHRNAKTIIDDIRSVK